MAALASSLPRAAFLAHYSGILAGAGGTVVVYKGGAIVIDLTVEQTASQREIEHLPLTDTSGTTLSRRGVGELRGARKDGTHLPRAESSASSAGTLDARFPFWTELLILFI